MLIDIGNSTTTSALIATSALIQSKLDEDTIFKSVLEKLSSYNISPTFKHNCNSCGGTLDMDINNHIFKCPYCGTVYAIGLNNINN